jgi:hypothetical protein
MNYILHYNALMDKAPKTRPKVGYWERHRIVPGCLGGKYEPKNVAFLTPEEHYVAHQLLIKIYPDNIGIIIAANMMANTRPNNKVYGWVKRRHSAHMISNNPNKDGELSKKMWANAPNEMRKKQSEIMKAFNKFPKLPRKWINDGINEKFILKTIPIQSGWFLGRLHRKT